MKYLDVIYDEPHTVIYCTLCCHFKRCSASYNDL